MNSCLAAGIRCVASREEIKGLVVRGEPYGCLYFSIVNGTYRHRAQTQYSPSRGTFVAMVSVPTSSPSATLVIRMPR